MLAVSPLRAIRSAPTTTAPMPPVFRKWPYHVVGDQRKWNSILMKLPGSETRTLQIRPGFGIRTLRFAAAFDGHPDHAQRSADSAGSQSAGIALRHHAAVLRHEIGAEPANALVGFPAFLMKFLRFFDKAFADREESPGTILSSRQR